MKRTYIVYSLSKDRTTQKFSNTKLQEIVDDISVFLQNCTTSVFNDPTDIRLKAYKVNNEIEVSDFSTKIIAKSTELFGVSKTEPISHQYPSGEPNLVEKKTWTPSKNKLSEAIGLIIDNTPMPKADFGPLELFMSYSFKLIDPVSKENLRNQEHVSNFCVWISRTKSCSPTLFFPFEEANKEFWTYIDSIISFLPFKLEEKYLRIAHVNKQGEVKSFKKIQRPLTQ